MNAPVLSRFLSPLTGLDALWRDIPRLTPWATICRCSATWVSRPVGFLAAAALCTVGRRSGRQDHRMNWSVQNLRLILRAPFPTAAHSAGAERRQRVAHGVSRGFRVAKRQSPGGATEGSVRGWASSHFLPPLPGLGFSGNAIPRLTPWATICRCSAALVLPRAWALSHRVGTAPDKISK